MAQLGCAPRAALQLATRNPLLWRRGLHMWGAGSTSRIRCRCSVTSSARATRAPTFRPRRSTGFCATSSTTAPCSRCTEQDGGLLFNRDMNHALAQARLWGNAPPGSPVRASGCLTGSSSLRSWRRHAAQIPGRRRGLQRRVSRSVCQHLRRRVAVLVRRLFRRGHGVRREAALRPRFSARRCPTVSSCSAGGFRRPIIASSGTSTK
jgi:hypothetical protein